MLFNSPSFAVSSNIIAQFVSSWQKKPTRELFESTQVAFLEVTFTKTESQTASKMPETPCELRPPNSFSGTQEQLPLMLRESQGQGLCHLPGCAEGTSVHTLGTESCAKQSKHPTSSLH